MSWIQNGEELISFSEVVVAVVYMIRPLCSFFKVSRRSVSIIKSFENTPFRWNFDETWILYSLKYTLSLDLAQSNHGIRFFSDSV